MNLKVVNLVAIQFGIFVGMMSWLVYSHFESAKPQRLAEERPRGPVNSAAISAPAYEPGDQGPQSPDDRTDAARAQSVTDQPVPVVQYEYSPEAVKEYSALAAQMYYRQIAPRRYTSSAPENGHVTADAPTYTEVDQAPTVAPVEYEEQPQTVAYDEPAQIVAYAQPYPFLAYSNARFFRHRCSPSPHRGVLTPVRRRHDGSGPRLSGQRDACPPRSLGIIQRQEADALSCRPTQNFRHRGNAGESLRTVGRGR